MSTKPETDNCTALLWQIDGPQISESHFQWAKQELEIQATGDQIVYPVSGVANKGISNVQWKQIWNVYKSKSEDGQKTPIESEVGDSV